MGQALGWGKKVFSNWLKTWRTKENTLKEKQRPEVWDFKCVLAKDWHARYVMGTGPRLLDWSGHCSTVQCPKEEEQSRPSGRSKEYTESWFVEQSIDAVVD
ncbi:hypothetical protein STEG23_001235 [Scotinomys teguina]